MQLEFITALATIASVIVAAWSVKNASLSARESLRASVQSARESIEEARRSNQILKTVDVTLHCAQRYEELSTLRTEIIRLEAEEAADGMYLEGGEDTERKRFTRQCLIEELSDHYYRRFWALKSDQFDYWLYGVLDHDTFYDWSYYLVVKLRNEYECSPIAPRFSLYKSWIRWRESDSRAGHGGSNPMFVTFTDSLVKLARSKKNDQGYMPRQVLNLIKPLEIDNCQPGYARRYRNEIWAGQTWEQFETAMLRDFDLRMAQSVGDDGI